MASTLRDLIERLEQYVEEKGLDADKTFFWVCDFCVRQSGGNADDVDRFGQVVQSIGKTVMFLEPWDKMIKTRPSDRVNCLSRAWCVAGPTNHMRAQTYTPAHTFWTRTCACARVRAYSHSPM